MAAVKALDALAKRLWCFMSTATAFVRRATIAPGNDSEGIGHDD